MYHGQDIPLPHWLEIDSLARRGPDGEGVARWGPVLGASTRQAILDLTVAGRQRMLTDDRTKGVVFNGAIYNFKELRAVPVKERFRPEIAS